MESVCKYLESVNFLQCTKILLQISAYVNAVYRRFCDRISLSQTMSRRKCVQQERQKVLQRMHRCKIRKTTLSH